MRRIVILIIVSFFISLISLICYLSDLPALVISTDKMNGMLSAVFGASISILIAELIEYSFLCNELEDRLLAQARRMISAFAGLKPVSVEHLGTCSSNELIDLLCAYFDEEEINSSPCRIVPIKHDARNKLMQQFITINENEYEIEANHRCSSFNRYITRALDNIDKACSSYQLCFDKGYDIKNSLLETMRSLSYLPIGAFWRNSFRFTNNKKKHLLKDINELIEDAYSELEHVVGQYRLYRCHQAGYSDLLKALRACEKCWMDNSEHKAEGITFISQNKYAFDLFQRISEFAENTSSAKAQRYRKIPWWITPSLEKQT